MGNPFLALPARGSGTLNPQSTEKKKKKTSSKNANDPNFLGRDLSAFILILIAPIISWRNNTSHKTCSLSSQI